MTIDQGNVLGGRYVVGEVLGRGGMADVFRGEDRTLGRAVAIKIMRGVEAGAADRARFDAEAQTLARLSHPGLVTVLDAGSEDGQPYLVMELIDGPTLADRLGVALPPDEVAVVGRQLAEGLEYAHAAGVIHRDVKPGNVLLGDDGHARLADFGVARLVDQATHHTQEGMTLGSPAYVAPEQLTEPEVSPVADIYSLGLVLLEALTGRREFQGTPTEAAFARLHHSPEVPDHLPAEWRALLQAMTARDPDERPTAGEVAALVPGPGRASGTSAEETAPFGRAPLGRRSSGRAAAPRRARRRWRPGRRHLSAPLTVAGLVATLAFLVVLAVLSSTTGGDVPQAEPELPEGVPSQLQAPLSDLHEAVHGGAP